MIKKTIIMTSVGLIFSVSLFSPIFSFAESGNRTEICRVNGEPNRIAHIRKLNNVMFNFSLRGIIDFQTKALKIPGVKELTISSPITLSQFEKQAMKIKQHGLNKKTKCLYVISYNPREVSGSDIVAFEKYFYKQTRTK